jgi:tetratricopeptide (TPR) repeat protein
MTDLDRLDEQLAVARRRDDHDRVVALIEEAVARPHAAEQMWLPELLWELGQAHARAGRYDEAIEAQQRAIDAGEEGTPDPRATIAEYHLLAGRREAADALFAQLWAASPGDVWLCNMAGMAYQDHGDHETALRWLDAGLEGVLETGQPDELLAQLANLRVTSLRALDREVPDDLDARAEEALTALRAHAELERAEANAQVRPAILERIYAGETEVAERWDDVVDVPVARGGGAMALAWFPAQEFDEAVARWPELATHGADHATYVRALQGHLLGFAAHGTKPRLAPITVDGLVAFARSHERDPAASATRAHYAAEVARRGEAVAWPPGRNAPCWCGSGTKYKRCCATVPRPDTA